MHRKFINHGLWSKNELLLVFKNKQLLSIYKKHFGVDEANLRTVFSNMKLIKTDQSYKVSNYFLLGNKVVAKRMVLKKNHSVWTYRGQFILKADCGNPLSKKIHQKVILPQKPKIVAVTKEPLPNVNPVNNIITNTNVLNFVIVDNTVTNNITVNNTTINMLAKENIVTATNHSNHYGDAYYGLLIIPFFYNNHTKTEPVPELNGGLVLAALVLSIFFNSIRKLF